MQMRISAIVAGAAVIVGAGARVDALPAFSHVYVIVMENHEYSQIVGNAQAPYVNFLIRQYGLATAYTGVTHPSLPNYMALTGGATAFSNDCETCVVDAPNIADAVEASGRSWRAYEEDMPAACWTADANLYTTHHDPFVHYQDIVSNQTRCTGGVVPMSQFGVDLDEGTLPQFVWITPNLCSDMHDCSIATGDAWLQRTVPAILRAPDFATSVLFIVWDEGTTSVGGGGQVPLVMVSPLVAPGVQDATPTNHYSLLRTIEDAWALTRLGASAGAVPLTAAFATTSAAPSHLVATAAASTVQLTWQPPSGAAAIGYVIELGNAPGLANIARVSTGTTSTTLTGTATAPGVFYLRVKALTASGLSPASNEVVLAIGGAPAAPANVTLSRLGSTETMNWQRPSAGGAPTNYTVEIGSAPDQTDLGSFQLPATTTSLSFSIVGVPSGIYYFRLRSSNAVGASGPSNEVVLQVP